MGRVAGSALPVFRRLMFEFRGSNAVLDVVMAFEAQRRTGLNQQILVLRMVRLMTGRAFSILHGLMFEFGSRVICASLIVAGEANLAWLPFHLLRELRFVAGSAIALGIR